VESDEHPAKPSICSNTVGHESGAHALVFLMDEILPRGDEVNLGKLIEPYRGLEGDRWDFARSDIEHVSSGVGASCLGGHTGKPGFGFSLESGKPHSHNGARCGETLGDSIPCRAFAQRVSPRGLHHDVRASTVVLTIGGRRK
jgi:hypothetical protein